MKLMLKLTGRTTGDICDRINTTVELAAIERTEKLKGHRDPKEKKKKY